MVRRVVTGTAVRAPPPLVCVLVVVRDAAAGARAQVAALPHVVALISKCLDHAVPKIWTLPRACEANLLSLLPRLAAHGVPNGVDPHYWKYQCNQGLVFAVKHDNLDMVEWLHAYCPDVLPYAAMTEAARTGNVWMLEWLSARHEHVVWLPDLIVEAASAGQLVMLQWLRSHPRNEGYSRVWTVLVAARGGHLDMVKWIHEQRQDPREALLIAARDAITGGHSDMAKYLFEHCEPKELDFASGICIAAEIGDLALLEWLYSRSTPAFQGLNYHPVKFALRGGHFHVVQWLQTHHFPDEDPALVMYHAVLHGNLELVQQLHGSHTVKSTAHAMDDAASNGYLDIVKWLHENRTEGCTTDAMDCAAADGHLAVVKWLHANRPEGGTESAMDFAAGGGHLEMLQWLHENRSEGCTEGAMNMATCNGHLEVVKWVHKNRTEGCTAAAMDYAAFNGHLDVVQWLHENRTEGCTVDTMRRAARNGHFDILVFLHTHRTEGCGRNAFDNIVACIAYMEIVQWLQEKYPGSVAVGAMRARESYMPAVFDHILGPWTG